MTAKALVDISSSGTYTPTVSGASNCTVNTVGLFRYIQVGKFVMVSGISNVNATASVAAEFFITLPIATDLTGAYGQLSGAGSHAQVGASYVPLGVLGDAASDKAQVAWRSGTDTASRELYINFTYTLA